MDFSNKYIEDDISTEIVTQIAKREDATITELPPLYNAIDPDCLAMLLDSDGVTVSFSYGGYSVTVSSDRSITLQDEKLSTNAW